MIKKCLSLTALTIILISSRAYADNCNFKNIDFGSSQEKIKETYKLETPAVATTGEAKIVSGASEICGDLPETAVMEFLLIDDKLVQLRIKNKNTDNAIYKYATTTFGEKDNKSKDRKIKKEKMGLWKTNNASVVYSTYTAGKKDLEELTITSKKHDSLFSNANKTKAQDIDNYLKEKKRGKYKERKEN